MYTMYVNASNNTSSNTHVSWYMVCKIHPVGYMNGATNNVVVGWYLGGFTHVGKANLIWYILPI